MIALLGAKERRGMRRKGSGLESNFEKYAVLARELGAVDAIVICVRDIVFDPRTYIKCMYGCSTWGKSWICPSAPGALKPWEAEDVLSRYKKALIIHTHDKDTSQMISLSIESKAFVDGYYFAFSMSDCGLCQECSFPDREPCRFPRKARPAMQAMGIDVFATARGQGLPIETLADESCKENWYSLVMLE
jgi:predicted metal-binding protein